MLFYFILSFVAWLIVLSLSLVLCFYVGGAAASAAAELADVLMAAERAVASGGPQVEILPHVVGRVYLLAKSQGGSRFIQTKLEQVDQLYFGIFFSELRNHVAELMMDRSVGAMFVCFSVALLFLFCLLSF